MSNGQLWDFGCGIINGFCIISQQWLLNLSKPFHCHNFSDKDINFEYNISTHRFNPTYAEFATSCDSKEVDATIIWNNISMTCIHCAIPNWRQKVTVFVSTDWNQKIIEKLKKKKKTLDPTCHVFKWLRIENMTYNDHYTFDGISWTILGHNYALKHLYQLNNFGPLYFWCVHVCVFIIIFFFFFFFFLREFLAVMNFQ